MAAEAVLRVREVELKSKETITKATEQARRITAEADKKAQERKKEILRQARATRQEVIDAATKKAEQESADLTQQGNAERDRLLTPDPAKEQEAINFIIERIVSVNGDR